MQHEEVLEERAKKWLKLNATRFSEKRKFGVGEGEVCTLVLITH